jgi:hypothetical protein
VRAAGRASGRACERQGVRAAGRTGYRAVGRNLARAPPGPPPLRRRYVTLLHNSPGKPAAAAQLCHFVTQLSRETRLCASVMSLCYTILPGNPPQRRSYVTLLHNSPGKPAAVAQLCQFVSQLLRITRRSGAVMSLCYTTPPENSLLRLSYVILLHNSPGNSVTEAQLCHFVTQLSRETCRSGAVMSLCYIRRDGFFSRGCYNGGCRPRQNRHICRRHPS